MSEAQFTPGPWFSQKEHCGDYTIWSRHEVTHLIGTVTDDEDDAVHTDVAANGSLIAAAPELYEALEALLGSVGVDSCAYDAERYRMAEAALTKARGETPNG